MLSARILTAVVGIPILLAIAYLGGPALLAGLGLLAVLGMREFYSIAEPAGLKPVRSVGYFAVLGWLGVIYNISLQVVEGFVAYSFMSTSVLVAAAFSVLWRFPRYSLSDLAVTYVGTFYIGGLLGYLLLLRYLSEHGQWFLLTTLFITWAGDTGAYFAGRWWGKHRLADRISPQKTWEGLAGGVGLSVLVAMAIGERFGLSHGLGALLGALAALAGAVGDLTESALKRMAGVKDSGRMLPGHGGVLDRFDSLLFTAPLVYYFLRWFIID